LYTPDKTVIKISSIQSVKSTNAVTYLGKTVKSLNISTENETHVLEALINSDSLASVINTAISNRLILEKNTKEREKATIKVDPGALERLNDLVGMWQQGLLS